MSMADHTEPLQIAPDPETLHAFHRQQLSAMLDGELSPDEAKFMLRRLEHDVELARCWERWQVCGEVLRGRAERLLPGDFAARVAVAVQAPAARSQERVDARQRPRALRYWGGFGIAASLALVAAMALVRLPGNQASPDVVDVAATVGNPVPAVVPGAAAALAETGPVTATAEIPALARPAEAALTLADVPPVHSERAAQELLAPAAVPVLPRPWPRAGSGAGAFNVGYGPPPVAMDPFQPRWAPPSSVLWPESGVQPVPVPGASRQD